MNPYRGLLCFVPTKTHPLGKDEERASSISDQSTYTPYYCELLVTKVLSEPKYLKDSTGLPVSEMKD